MKGEKTGLIYPVFILVLVLGFVLRILLSPYLTYEGDFKTWMAWAYGIYQVGFSKFYSRYWCDYMPGYLYVLWALEHIHRAFPGIPESVLFKLPANVSDLGIAILVFCFLRGISGVRYAAISSLAYFLNPASLSNSTFWGQVDSVHALPLLLSVLLCLNRRFFLSGVSVSFAFMIKPQSVVMFPILGFLVVKGFLENVRGKRFGFSSFSPLLFFTFAFLATSILVTVPFISWDISTRGLGVVLEPLYFIEERFRRAYTQYAFASLNAFNFWGAFAMWKSDQKTFLGITYQRWGTVVFGLIYALILSGLLRLWFSGWKKGLSGAYDRFFKIQSLQASFLVLFSLFLFVTRVHERHLLPAIVFFTLVAFCSLRFWFFYGILSSVYVFNLLYAYTELVPRVSGNAGSYFLLPASSIKPFIPGIATLLVSVFILVLVDFLKGSKSTFEVKDTG